MTDLYADIMEIMKEEHEVYTETSVGQRRRRRRGEPRIRQPASSDSSSSRKCPICSKYFYDAPTLRRHKKIIHKAEAMERKGSGRFKCSECKLNFQCTSKILEHYPIDHGDIVIEEEQLMFQCRQDFTAWKTELENSSQTRFVTHSGYNKRLCKSFVTEQMQCHINNLFKKKSKKERYFCPARMTLRTDSESGVVSVHFIPTHVGHDWLPTPTIMPHIPSKEQDDHLQVDNGVSIPIDYDSSQRLLSMNGHDVIEPNSLDVGCDTVLGENNAMAIDVWVIQIKSDEDQENLEHKKSKVLNRLVSLKDELNNCTTEAEVDAINFHVENAISDLDAVRNVQK